MQETETQLTRSLREIRMQALLMDVRMNDWAFDIEYARLKAKLNGVPQGNWRWYMIALAERADA